MEIRQVMVIDARRKLGLTQLKFSQLLGVTSTTVSRWECGTARPGPPTMKLLARLVAESKTKNGGSK